MDENGQTQDAEVVEKASVVEKKEDSLEVKTALEHRADYTRQLEEARKAIVQNEKNLEAQKQHVLRLQGAVDALNNFLKIANPSK